MFPLKQSIVVKTPLSRTGSEACETCGQYQRQLTELQRQLLLVKAEKDEALKLKEEVNLKSVVAGLSKTIRARPLAN